LDTTVEDDVADQPAIRQNSWSEVPSGELHPPDFRLAGDLAFFCRRVQGKEAVYGQGQSREATRGDRGRPVA
jgi:hypothetical protein